MLDVSIVQPPCRDMFVSVCALQSGAKATAVQTLRVYRVAFAPREASGLRRVYRRFNLAATEASLLQDVTT